MSLVISDKYAEPLTTWGRDEFRGEAKGNTLPTGVKQAVYGAAATLMSPMIVVPYFTDLAREDETHIVSVRTSQRTPGNDASFQTDEALLFAHCPDQGRTMLVRAAFQDIAQVNPADPNVQVKHAWLWLANYEPRNVSSPSSFILGLYMQSQKKDDATVQAHEFMRLKWKQELKQAIISYEHAATKMSQGSIRLVHRVLNMPVSAAGILIGHPGTQGAQELARIYGPHFGFDFRSSSDSRVQTITIPVTDQVAKNHRDFELNGPSTNRGTINALFPLEVRRVTA